jgi:hypothetical protein
MRLLVHGMQSSGASAFTMFLAQRPEALALVDIPNDYAAPYASSPLDFVAKVVITTAYPLAVHVARFRPDRTILFLRDPRDNYASLQTKNYRNHCGLMREKFRLLDQAFAERGRYDAVIYYEDFVARDPAVLDAVRALGWAAEENHFAFGRRHEHIVTALWEHEPALMEDIEIAFGSLRALEVTDRFRDKAADAEVDAALAVLCPELLAYYRDRSGARHLNSRSAPVSST